MVAASELRPIELATKMAAGLVTMESNDMMERHKRIVNYQKPGAKYASTVEYPNLADFPTMCVCLCGSVGLCVCVPVCVARLICRILTRTFPRLETVQIHPNTSKQWKFTRRDNMSSKPLLVPMCFLAMLDLYWLRSVCAYTNVSSDRVFFQHHCDTVQATSLKLLF